MYGCDGRVFCMPGLSDNRMFFGCQMDYCYGKIDPRSDSHVRMGGLLLVETPS